MCSSSITLTGKKKAVKTPLVSLWNAGVLTTSPRKSFSVRIVAGAHGGIMVGFCARENFQPNAQNWLRGYFMQVLDGGLYGPAGGRRAYAEPVREGSVVEANFDSATHTVSFAVDGTPCGVAFQDVSEPALYGAVEFYDHGAAVELV